ncbi:hypothetical protein Nizo1840_0517 [Lactiplantibacillus plantarum]|nr:hypothetical protein Nizo1840_0517 [Lactiplantibacillus plantarum]
MESASNRSRDYAERVFVQIHGGQCALSWHFTWAASYEKFELYR